jgi:hypothetical protein
MLKAVGQVHMRDQWDDLVCVEEVLPSLSVEITTWYRICKTVVNYPRANIWSIRPHLKQACRFSYRPEWWRTVLKIELVV